MHQIPTAASTISRQYEYQSARSQTSYMHKRNSSQGPFNRQSVIVVKSPDYMVDFNQTMPNSTLFSTFKSPGKEGDFQNSGEIDLKGNGPHVMRMLQKVQKKNKQAHLEAVPFNASRPSSKQSVAVMSDAKDGSAVEYAAFVTKAPSSVSQKHRPKFDMNRGSQVASSGSKRIGVSQSNRTSPKMQNLTARLDGPAESANKDRQRFELQISKIKENHNKAFDKESLAHNMSALLSHSFLAQKNSQVKSSHKQVPWHLRRNPISGMQYTQNLRSCSNNDL